MLWLISSGKSLFFWECHAMEKRCEIISFDIIKWCHKFIFPSFTSIFYFNKMESSLESWRLYVITFSKWSRTAISYTTGLTLSQFLSCGSLCSGCPPDNVKGVLVYFCKQGPCASNTTKKRICSLLLPLRRNISLLQFWLKLPNVVAYDRCR